MTVPTRDRRPAPALVGAVVLALTLAFARGAGAEVLVLPNPQGKVDLVRLLQVLGERGVNELHVEAGHKLNGSLLREALVDELLVYLAPRLLGPGRGIAAIGPLAALAGSLDFELVDIERVGADLRLRLRPPRRALF